MTAMAEHGHHHGHGHVHIDEADWEAWADQAEGEGELHLGFLTDTKAWIEAVRRDAPAVRRVIDIGSGPGVGTCELARLYPEAHVIAVDASPAMLSRAAQRAVEHGLEDRVSTHLAELPAGLDGIGRADVIWASMSLHHMGDEVAALRLLGDLLEPAGPGSGDGPGDAPGLIAIAELAEPMRVLPDDLGLGRAGLADRLEAAGAAWFAQMRAGLAGTVASSELAVMVAAAGLEVVGSRVARQHVEPPLPHQARLVAAGHLRRTRQQLHEILDADDLQTLDVLTDEDDPRGVMHRPDLFVAASRQIVIARRS